MTHEDFILIARLEEALKCAKQICFEAHPNCIAPVNTEVRREMITSLCETILIDFKALDA